jgi:Sec-independent protein translocase protein TatA
MELLFLLADWQALAKLRLHTERTLDILRNVTRSLGITLRAFQKHAGTTYKTRELPREAASRVRREMKASQKREKHQKGQAAGSTTSHSMGTSNKGKDVIQEAATPGDAGKGHLIVFAMLFMIA